MFSYRSRAKTTMAQRKAQPPSKFNFDRNSLRTLEISGPIQIPPPASVNSYFSSATLPLRTTKSIADESSLCQALVSSPVSRIADHCIETNKLVPVRPAPPRPDHLPQRTPTWAPQVGSGSSTVGRTSSLRSPSDTNAARRPLSSSSFRPSCPPPRPPPPKSDPTSKQDNLGCVYEDITKNLDEQERSATPNSTYYDDCQTLDFSNTPLSFVHKPAQSAKRGINSSEIPFKNNFKSQEQSDSFVNKPTTSSKLVISKTPRSGESSVAALAQKFEKQESYPKKNFNPNTSMRPPFKSRPLPPRPGDTQV